MLRIAVRWDFEAHPLLFASSGGGRSDKSCLPKVPSLLEKPKAPVASLHLQAGRGKQVQLHRINPFLQLSIPSSSWHFSAEQHRNNSTAQSSSLITPINHGDDKTKPRRASHGNIFGKGQHLQLPGRKKIILVGSWAQQTHSQSIPRAVGPPGSCLELLPRSDHSRCLVFISAKTATPSMCAASALLGREGNASLNRGIQGFSPFLSCNGMGEAEAYIGRFVLGGGYNIFYLYKLTESCGCAWQLAFHNRN